VSEIIRIVAIAVHMLLAFGVIILVLAHSGKDAGLSGAFGVGSSSFGSTQIMERNLAFEQDAEAFRQQWLSKENDLSQKIDKASRWRLIHPMFFFGRRILKVKQERN